MGQKKKIRNKKMGKRSTSYIGGLSAVIRNQIAIGNRKPLPAENQANTIIAYHTSIDAMTGGWAEKTHFDTLVYAMNVAVVLADNDIGAEHMPVIQDALEGLARCKERYQSTGKFGLDGDALIALKRAGEIHELHIQQVSRGELAAAIDAMHDRIARGKVRAEREAA